MHACMHEMHEMHANAYALINNCWSLDTWWHMGSWWPAERRSMRVCTGMPTCDDDPVAGWEEDSPGPNEGSTSIVSQIRTWCAKIDIDKEYYTRHAWAAPQEGTCLLHECGASMGQARRKELTKTQQQQPRRLFGRKWACRCIGTLCFANRDARKEM